MEENLTKFGDATTIEELKAQVEKLQKEIAVQKLDVALYKTHVETLNGVNVLLRLLGRHVYSL